MCRIRSAVNHCLLGRPLGSSGSTAGWLRLITPVFRENLLGRVIQVGPWLVFRLPVICKSGNPGGLGTASWPKGGTNVYGKCTGSNSAACAYQYGWNLAFVDATRPGLVIPGMFKWWLDVETVNSWDTGSEGMARNAADLEGMTAYFEGLGAHVGIYSSGTMWATIVGESVGGSSNLSRLNNWRPGANDQTEAKANCGMASLTGGKVVMTQYSKGKFDYDIPCF